MAFLPLKKRGIGYIMKTYFNSEEENDKIGIFIQMY